MEASANQGKEANPKEILTEAYRKASQEYTAATIVPDILTKVEYVCQNEQNRAGVRLLMACLLAKVYNPSVDVRKPYTEIGTPDSFSGRTYDEQYIAGFVNEYELPCNSTTAFLTPALRNRNDTLATDVKIVGRPPQLYKTVLELLNDTYTGKVAAKDLLIETVHCLILERDRQKQRMINANKRYSEILHSDRKYVILEA